MKTLRFLIALLAATVIFSSCSKDDDEIAPMVGPDITYAQSTYEIDFMEKGESELPLLKWNGNVGTLSLAQSIPGLYINQSNGVVNWNGNLPLGTNEFTVVATNSDGQKTTNLTIVNKFKGEFTGGLNEDPNSTMVPDENVLLDFDENGEISMSINGWPANGTWTEEDNVFVISFNYVGFPDIDYSFELELDHWSTSANMIGHWYFGAIPTNVNKGGYVSVEFK